jgi:Flp pilus assembly protein TadD
MNMHLARVLTLGFLALCLQQAAFAADSGPAPTAAAPDKLAQARGLIKAKQWGPAVEELKRVNDPSSADWNNLMGFSMRRGTAPDLEASERYYNEALRINPNHRGALEYSGELYLMKGDLGTAERRLAVLDKACTFGCEEYTDLKKAIAQYESSRKR